MKTICIYHSRDLDGWMSAAIVKKYYNELKQCSVCGQYLDKDSAGSTECCGGITTLTIPDFLGWDYGNEIPDLSEYDKVIMCDISFPKDEMLKIYDRIEDNFIWIDHHISAIKENEDFIFEGNQFEMFAACELTWQYFFPNQSIPEIVRLLGRYDCFGHKGTDEEQKVLKFQYAAREEISDYEEAYDALCADIDHNITGGWINNGTIIYNYLCTEAKQTYAKAFPIQFGKEEDLEKVNFLCVNQERFNPINFGIDYHKDGYDGFACFWMMKNGKWQFSLYNDNGEVDCSMIAKSFGGGGHRGASGMVLNHEQLLSLIK